MQPRQKRRPVEHLTRSGGYPALTKDQLEVVEADDICYMACCYLHQNEGEQRRHEVAAEQEA